MGMRLSSRQHGLRNKAVALFNGVAIGCSGCAEARHETENSVMAAGASAAANRQRGGERTAVGNLCRRSEQIFAHDLGEVRGEVFQQQGRIAMVATASKEWLKSKPLHALGERKNRSQDINRCLGNEPAGSEHRGNKQHKESSEAIAACVKLKPIHTRKTSCSAFDSMQLQGLQL